LPATSSISGSSKRLLIAVGREQTFPGWSVGGPVASGEVKSFEDRGKPKAVGMDKKKGTF
jgi:hypothetical protein